MFGLGIFDAAKIGAGAALGAFLMFGVSAAILQPQARQEGRALERADALERSMEIIRQRSADDAEIGRMSDSQLCAALGGRWMPDQAICE